MTVSRTMRPNLCGTIRLAMTVCLLAASAMMLNAQTGAVVEGTVTDPKGAVIGGAKVTIGNAAGATVASATSDGQGHFSFPGLASGTYTESVVAAEFGATTKKLTVTANHADDASVTLQVAGANTEISVEAQETNSVAAAYAPMDALLEEHSARTEITAQMIQNFMSPLADYGEAVQMAPGTFTTNGNGIGLGQSKTIFRGFPDGDYDIDFDGIPFYDTNTPTHHSWAFFPTQWIGGIDFDRSPGTASTIGPTPFGGSIHLLSRELSPIQNIRAGVSYGSWGTVLADVQYDSGSILPNKKLSTFIDVQHMDSKSYQSNNFQNRNAGSIKMQYRFSPTTTVTGFSGVLWLDANTPNFNATRCQMYGPSSTNSTTTCIASGTTLLPYTGAGIRFLLAPNTDPLDYLAYQYNFYHVPTDFEYVSLKTHLPLNIDIDFKPYTYNYDNSEKYTNATPITENTTVPFNGNPASTTWYGITVAPCNVPVTKKAKTASGNPTVAIPCGVDKYNSYRKYGETFQLTQTSKLGILRAGLWYEWADTNRHQFPSDPLNNWADQPLGNFNESFWNNTFQPFVEYQFHVGDKLNITAGTKFAYYTIDLKQYADDGKTIGCLCSNTTTQAGASPTNYVRNYGDYTSWLPSLDFNYRVQSNWSVYAQLSTGSIVPPSSVYDYNQTVTAANPSPMLAIAPKQQRNTTYQAGMVAKFKQLTLDADAFHIKFQNSYVASTNTDPETYTLQPGTITKGFEGEANFYFGHGFSAYGNASVVTALYTGNLPLLPTGATTGTVLSLQVPDYLWVAQTPTDIESYALLYQHRGFDFGFTDKRVGEQRIDNTNLTGYTFHNQAIVNPFSTLNGYLNYTIRAGSRFDQTKIRLSVNNLLDSHNMTNVGLTANPLSQPLAANAAYTDPFNTTGPTPIAGADTISILPGRSITLSATFGFTPSRR